MLSEHLILKYAAFVSILWIATFPSIIDAVQLCQIQKHNDVGLLVKAMVPFEPFDLLERSIGIPIPISSILWSELINYMEGYNATHGILALGIGMLLNHNNQFAANVRKIPLYEPGLRKFREPFEPSIDFLHEITSYVEVEEQLTVDYGDDWFTLRNMTQVPINDNPESLTTQSLVECPSSFTHLTREGKIVATTFLAAGTVIEISRAILIPVTPALLSSGPLEEMLWWSDTKDESINVAEPSDLFLDRYPTSPSDVLPYSHGVEHAMLLSGHGALYKALPCSSFSSASTNIQPNVEYAWFEANGNTCNNLMLMSFKALRDILEGDEIVVSDICHPEHFKSYRKQVINLEVKACLASSR